MVAVVASLALLGVGCGGAGGSGAAGDTGGGPEIAARLPDAVGEPDVLRIAGLDLARGDAGEPDEDVWGGPDASRDGGGPPDDVPADTADTADGEAWDGATLSLEPGSLSFFSLPVGSLRHAVSGWDAHTATCVSLIFDYSNTGHAPGAWCAAFGPQFPYVLVRPDPRGRCGDWDYGSDLVTGAVAGCVDFEGAAPGSMDLVDLDVRVSGLAFTGRILASNRERRYPQPVSFGLRLAPGAAAVVQARDDWGLPGWLSLEGPEGPLLAWDRCDLPTCGDSGAPPCPAGPEVRRLEVPETGAADPRGSIWASWDGRLRVDDEEACRRRVYAEAGAYRATFCYGRQSDAAGHVTDPVCRTVEFRYPTSVVTWVVED